MRFFFASIFFLFSFLIKGQNYIDLLKIQTSGSYNNKFDSTDSESNLNEQGIDLTLPIKLNDNAAILTGLVYEGISTRLYPDSANHSIISVGLKIGYNTKISDRWSITGLLLPKVASESKNINANDFQLGGLFLFKYNKRENYKYNLGLYYNDELFGSFFVPLLGLYYKSANEKFESNLTLPVWADMNYKLKKWLTFGVNFVAFVRSYNMESANNYLVKKSNELYGYLQFNLGKSFIIQSKVGHSVGRSYSAYQNTDRVDFGISAFRFGDDRTPLNPTFQDGVILQSRLIYRFNL